MKRTFIKDLLVFAAGMLLVLNVACKKDDDETTNATANQNTILVTLGDASDPYWQDVRRGLETEFAKHDCDYVINYVNQVCDTDTRTIINALNNCDRNSVKGVFFVPFSLDVENAALALAKAGIPVISMDSPMQNTDLQSACRAEVHTDWTHDVDTMFNIMESLGGVSSTLVVGQNTTPASIYRFQRMKERAGQDFHGIAIKLADGDPADTICSYLRANGDIQCVMILNASSLTPNVFDSLSVNNYGLYVFDESELVLQNTDSFDARLSQQPELLGEKAMEALFTEPESKVVYIPSILHVKIRPF